MPMLGVMSETLEREGGSIKGEDDFFSVARTTPLVAREEHVRIEHFEDRAGILEDVTFDSQRSDTLVDGVQGVFCNGLVRMDVSTLERPPQGRQLVRRHAETTNLFVPVYH